MTTPAATPEAPKQLQIEPVEDFIFKGLLQRLHEVFGAHAVFVDTTDEIQALVKKLQEGDKKLSYPFLFVSNVQMAAPTDSWRSLPFLRRGIDALLSTDMKVSHKITCMPVDFTFEINYRDDDFRRVKNFVKRWLMAAKAGYLKFSIQYGRVNFRIHLVLSEDITIPKREAEPTNVQEYPLTTSLVVKGWVSEEKLRRQQAATQVEVEAYLADQKPDAVITQFKF